MKNVTFRQLKIFEAVARLLSFSARTIAMELAVGRLAILRIAGTPVLRQWHLVRRAEKRHLPLTEAFREFLLAEGAGLMDEKMTAGITL